MNIIDGIKGGGMQCIAQDITAFSYLGAYKDMGQIDLCRKSKATHKSGSKYRYDLGAVIDKHILPLVHVA
jgi:hypothetical protein